MQAVVLLILLLAGGALALALMRSRAAGDPHASSTDFARALKALEPSGQAPRPHDADGRDVDDNDAADEPSHHG